MVEKSIFLLFYCIDLLNHSPQFIVGLDILVSKEGYAREVQVLMVDEYPHRQQVGLTAVVDEPGDVAVPASVYAVCLSVLSQMQHPR